MLQAERAGNCNVFPLGAVTKDHAAEELSEIGQLVDGGAVAFTGAKKAISNAEIMRRALEYARTNDSNEGRWIVKLLETTSPRARPASAD